MFLMGPTPPKSTRVAPPNLRPACLPKATDAPLETGANRCRPAAPPQPQGLDKPLHARAPRCRLVQPEHVAIVMGPLHADAHHSSPWGKGLNPAPDMPLLLRAHNCRLQVNRYMVAVLKTRGTGAHRCARAARPHGCSIALPPKATRPTPMPTPMPDLRLSHHQDARIIRFASGYHMASRSLRGVRAAPSMVLNSATPKPFVAAGGITHPFQAGAIR